MAAATMVLLPLDLRRLLYPPRQTGKTAWLEPDLADMAQALKNQKTRRDYRAPRVTLEVLWDDYCDDAAAQGLKAYSRSRFFELLKEHVAGPGQEPEMRFDYEPGGWTDVGLLRKDAAVADP